MWSIIKFIFWFLLIIGLAWVLSGIICSPRYHCIYESKPQWDKPHIYGLCRKHADDLIFKAQRELGYKWGKTDAEVMALVRKYIKELPRIRKEGRVERK